MANNYAVIGQFLPKFKLIQAFMVVLITCKYEEDPIKIQSTRVVTWAANSVVGDVIWPKFKVIQALLFSLKPAGRSIQKRRR